MPANDTISVIIPVYNTSRYLRACLCSVLNQTHTALEIICIDDGSTDDSPAVLAAFTKQDERIKIITQSNKGLSAARNAGLSEAMGTYILFLDSDDFLEHYALQRLYEAAFQQNLDILYFSGTSFYETPELADKLQGYRDYYKRHGKYDNVLTGRALFTCLVNAREYRPSACLQFIRTDLLKTNGYAFYEGILFEDNLFTFQTILSAKRASCIPDVLYHRRIHGESIVTSKIGTEHARSHFLCYVQMMKLAYDANLNLDEMEAAEALIRAMYISAQDDYAFLPSQIRKKSNNLPPEIRMLHFLTTRTLWNARIRKIYDRLRSNPLLRTATRIPRKLIKWLTNRHNLSIY